MGISFEQPLALLLLAPALGGVVYLWRQSRRGKEGLRGRLIPVLRMLLVTLVILALAVPAVRYTVNRQAVVFVADLSDSVRQERSQIEEFIRQAMEARGPDDEAGIVAFGHHALVEWPVTEEVGFREFQSEVLANNTGLADGLRLAAALLPPDARRRIVVISDGQENLGDAVEQARFIRAQGVQVDIVPLEGPSGPEVLVDSVVAPSSANAGQRVPVEVTVGSTLEADATLQVSVDGALVSSRQVSLEAGKTRFSFDVGVDRPGFHTIRVTINSGTDTRLQNNRADAFVNVHGPPAVLVVEDREGAAKNVSEALKATMLQVDVRPAALFPESLEELGRYSGIVLVDVPAESLGQGKMEVIRGAVRDLGKGLLVVGGAHSFTMGEYRDTPLEEVLPVTSEIPEREEKGKVALALVIDKSGSMSGPGSDGVGKVEMAKEAARLSLEELEPYDLAGVVAFDTVNWWQVPMGEIGSGAHLKEMQDSIGTLISSGGTDIYPALVSAYLGLADAPAPRRHMVLLTDGISPPGDYPGLLSSMKAGDITLSTIAVGQDVDAGLLQWLADEGGGRFYFTGRARDIPQILTKETRLAARHAIVEEPTTVLVAGNSPVLRSTGGEFPTLGGYVATLPKNAAHVVLVSPRGDPLLAQWQFGLGRTIAWTSDSEGRWTSTLTAWKGVPVFWSALVDWTLPPKEAPFQVRGSVKAGVASLVVEGKVQEEARLSANIVGPRLDAVNIPLPAMALERFEAEFLANEQGPYLIQILEETPQGGRRSTTTGLVAPYSPEYQALEGGPGLLERLAAITNGKVVGSPSESFGPGLPPAYGDVPLAWWLLMAAALLLPLDIAFRRLNLSLTEAVSRLSTAKAWVLRRGVSRPTEPVSPVLANLRQRRAGRPRLTIRGTNQRESTVTNPPVRSDGQITKPEEEGPCPRKSVPNGLEQDREGTESTMERWLRAKRRARNR